MKAFAKLTKACKTATHCAPYHRTSGICSHKTLSECRVVDRIGSTNKYRPQVYTTCIIMVYRDMLRYVACSCGSSCRDCQMLLAKAAVVSSACMCGSCCSAAVFLVSSCAINLQLTQGVCSCTDLHSSVGAACHSEAQLTLAVVVHILELEQQLCAKPASLLLIDLVNSSTRQGRAVRALV